MSERITLPCFKDAKETLQIVEILAGLRSLPSVPNLGTYNPVKVDCGCYAIFRCSFPYFTDDTSALASEMSTFHRPDLLFFNSASLRASLTFTFASTIAVGDTVYLNGPLGSRRSGFSLKGCKSISR